MKKLVLIALALLLAGCEHTYSALSCDQDGCKSLQSRMTKAECERLVERLSALPSTEPKKALICRDVGP